MIEQREKIGCYVMLTNHVQILHVCGQRKYCFKAPNVCVRQYGIASSVMSVIIKGSVLLNI